MTFVHHKTNVKKRQNNKILCGVKKYVSLELKLEIDDEIMFYDDLETNYNG